LVVVMVGLVGGGGGVGGGGLKTFEIHSNTLKLPLKHPLSNYHSHSLRHKGIARNIALLKVPLLAYHGDKDVMVPMVNTKHLVEEVVRGHCFFNRALRS
jgi:hypothetical protein